MEDPRITQKDTKADVDSDDDYPETDHTAGNVRVIGKTDERITSLEDLLAFFNVDKNAYEVDNYRVNSWEQHSVRRGFVTLYQVRAILRQKHPTEIAAAAREAIALDLEEFRNHTPYTGPVNVGPDRPTAKSEPVLLELALFDPHIGMLAWGKECGVAYDSVIAVTDYMRAFTHLLTTARFYNVEQILFPVGNDFFHVDTLADGGKGATTTRGTQQDIDTRLPKMFTLGRKALVAAIDLARRVAPVDVVIVPGNHDQQQMYRMGEVLNAWYRADDRVNVDNDPTLRKYYQYGQNLLAFTHGLEFKRRRDNLVTIMATEAPPEMWASTTHREFHVGHNHVAQELQYMVPNQALWEGRGIRVRSLPGLTPEDSWHYGQGYKHRRTATALAFRKSGGIEGLHEFNL